MLSFLFYRKKRTKIQELVLGESSTKYYALLVTFEGRPGPTWHFLLTVPGIKRIDGPWTVVEDQQI